MQATFVRVNRFRMHPNYIQLRHWCLFCFIGGFHFKGMVAQGDSECWSSGCHEVKRGFGGSAGHRTGRAVDDWGAAFGATNFGETQHLESFCISQRIVQRNIYRKPLWVGSKNPWVPGCLTKPRNPSGRWQLKPLHWRLEQQGGGIFGGSPDAAFRPQIFPRKSWENWDTTGWTLDLLNSLKVHWIFDLQWILSKSQWWKVRGRPCQDGGCLDPCGARCETWLRSFRGEIPPLKRWFCLHFWVILHFFP